MIEVTITPITKKVYDTLTPFEQGYVTYIQGEWPNTEVPKDCPYEEASTNWIRWNDGNFKAMQDVADGDD